MPARSLSRPLAVRISLGLLGLALLAGCRHAPPPFLFNPHQSVNVAIINSQWPRRFEDLTPAQREVYNQRLRPQLAHILWSTTRDVSDSAAVMRNLQNTGMKVEQMPFAWIYADDKIEVRFPEPSRSEVVPLSDAVLAIIEFGDPQVVRPITGKDGKQAEVWTYWDQGVRLTFEEGKRIKTDKSIPAVRNYLGQ